MKKLVMTYEYYTINYWILISHFIHFNVLFNFVLYVTHACHMHMINFKCMF